MVKPMRVLICGIPNVGKSTLINTLKGKRAAKTGDEAGVTKTEQRIALADDFYLYDTPGVLWPRIIVEQSGFNLAASGAIGVNAFDEETVALELLNYLIPHYPNELKQRYTLDDVASHTDEDMLEAIGRKRGAVQSGGRINLTKAAHIVIHDFRTAALGRVTLERPSSLQLGWLKANKPMPNAPCAKRRLKKTRKRRTNLRSVEINHT